MKDVFIEGLMDLTDFIIYSSSLNALFSLLFGGLQVRRGEADFSVSNLPELIMELGYVYWSEKPVLYDLLEELDSEQKF